MKEFRGYQSQVLELNPAQTSVTEIKIYKDFYLSKLKLKIDSISPENVMLELEKYLPVTNYKLLVIEEDGAFNYVLPTPKLIKPQHLIFKITNLHPTLSSKVQIFLQGYEETGQNVDLALFNQAKVKTINDLTISAGGINTEIIHQFDEDILLENIITHFTSGGKHDLLINLRNENTDQFLFREPVNLLFLNNFVDNVNGVYTPISCNRKDAVRFMIQNLNPTVAQTFSFALHGREKRRS